MAYSPLSLGDTIVAIATPPGTGAIAVIRASGKNAIEICSKIFHGKNLAEQPSHTLHFGKIMEGEKILDEVLASIFIAPHSYTGENAVEISTHGSPYIQEQIVQLLVKNGARLAKPGEFTLRAFLNGKMDLSQAEAVADLIASSSESAHAIAMQQMRGGFSGQIKQLRQELVNFASLIELELDFSEEDVEFANRKQLIDLVKKIQHLLSVLIDSFRLGNVLKNGVTTVIAGRPNAGKSTLLNVLLNEERAIVSEMPGTTRDTIEECINIDGILFRLIDTAGIREATDKIESMGVERTLEKIKQSTIVIYLFDVNEISVPDLKNDLAKLQLKDVNVVLVGNKIDKVGTDDARKNFSSVNDIIFISSKEEENIDLLKKKLFSTVLEKKINLENPIVSNVRHLEALTGAQQSLEEVLKGLHEKTSGELLALDIRKALDYLGQITGEISSEDLLANIFSRFCIGK